jgi:hypothetical protein
MASPTVKSFESSEMENQAQAAVHAIFRTIREQAPGWEAHQAEAFALDALRQVGRLALQEYFREKGDGNLGATLTDDEGNLYKRDSRRIRTYFSIFGKLDVTRLSYRAVGVPEAVFPLDALANLPDRQYSFPLQERIALAAQSGAFKEEMAKLERLTGTRISDSGDPALCAPHQRRAGRGPRGGPPLRRVLRVQGPAASRFRMGCAGGRLRRQGSTFARQ